MIICNQGEGTLNLVQPDYKSSRSTGFYQTHKTRDLLINFGLPDYDHDKGCYYPTKVPRNSAER